MKFNIYDTDNDRSNANLTTQENTTAIPSTNDLQKLLKNPIDDGQFIQQTRKLNNNHSQQYELNSMSMRSPVKKNDKINV